MTVSLDLFPLWVQKSAAHFRLVYDENTEII